VVQWYVTGFSLFIYYICIYLDLDEVKDDGHVVDFNVGNVAIATSFVVFVSDLMPQRLLHLQQNLRTDNACVPKGWN